MVRRIVQNLTIKESLEELKYRNKIESEERELERLREELDYLEERLNKFKIKRKQQKDIENISQ